MSIFLWFLGVVLRGLGRRYKEGKGEDEVRM